MTEYDNTGKATFWINDSDHPNAPQLKGTVYAHRDIRAGEELSIPLWNNQRANPHGPDYNPKAPRYTGRIEDKFVPTHAPRQESENPAPDDFDDPIPF